jgi:hypothetical protein
VRVLLALCLALTFVACAPPTTIKTQPGQVAFTADQILVRVGELQNAAIQANTNNGLSNVTTNIIVTWTTAAAMTLKTTPAGWQATLAASWKAAKPNIPTTNPTIAIAVGAVDALIGGLQ